MNRAIEKRFTEQARQLFDLCSIYIDSDVPGEKKSLLGQMAKLYEGLELQGLFEEIISNLDEPMSDLKRERYCFDLITPFEAYSNTLYPNVLIGESKESLSRLQGLNGTDELASIFEKQIEDANERARKYFDMAFDADALNNDDEGENIFFGLAHMITWYGNMLDAAFVMYGIDLKSMQNKCGVWIKQYWGGEAENRVRAMKISGYVGTRTLANEYISRLEQKPEPANSKQTTDAQSINQEPKQMELKDLLQGKLKTDEAVKVFQKAIDAQLITNSPGGLKWNDTKQLLAYFATKVSDEFSLTTRLDKDGNKTTAWKPFEILFREQDLKGAKNNWMRLYTKFVPTGFEKVDALF